MSPATSTKVEASSSGPVMGARMILVDIPAAIVASPEESPNAVPRPLSGFSYETLELSANPLYALGNLCHEKRLRFPTLGSRS